MSTHQHSSSCGGSCKSSAPRTTTFKQISRIKPVGPHPADCCSDSAPLAASSCCTSTPPSGHSHSHNHEACDSDDNEGGDEESPGAAQPNTQRLSWLVTGMDCPSCARKIENAVGGLANISKAKVLFATEKLVVDAPHNLSAESLSLKITQAVEAAGFTLIEPESPAAAAPSFLRENALLIGLIVLMLLSSLLNQFTPQFGKIAFTLTTLVGLWPVLRQAIRQTRSGTPFAIETLMSIAAIGALFIGATAEAAMVLLLFMVGEKLEAFAASRARSGVKALMALIPESAQKMVAGKLQTVPVASLRPDDVIEVSAGGRLPVDAVLMQAAASFDESALTGESVPVERQPGEKIPAGSLCVDTVAQLNVSSAPGKSAIDRILQLIEEAEERRAPIERFLDTFSRYYTPVIMLMALLVILIPPLAMGLAWETWIYRGLTLLLIGCPCALVISTPAAITSGLAAATRQGALIKGGAALEQLALVETIALDKTGTLTEGKPEVTDSIALADISVSQLLAMAAAVEVGSHHPLAKAIIEAATAQPALTAERRRALAGVGVEGWIHEKRVLVAAPKHLPENTLATTVVAQITKLELMGKTVVVIVQDERPVGLLAMQDKLRADAISALADLKRLGIETVMLTGDNPLAAQSIAAKLGIDFKAGLLPADKVRAVAELSQNRVTAMVGDGINDAPAMKAARIGIAMGSGTDVALETADAALTHNRLGGLAQMIELSRATRANIRQNITIALGLKGIFLVTTLIGLTGLWLAVLADSGATALVTANALRLLRKKS
ncbi:zinc/cadmium/mercury/lead-transporting ATPase [Serratia sp. M24T3]|uniref:zinc/cadmium/mercury/lead-transporting ATPase n=1 Tax=Serratia sp. M24T3 TaxID=932213 RepID=UPI00025BA7BF|nr:zinc/cadmium/mercury/lead-transporting ATPase [Serratia sp. M24T3]EIC82619.1 zinc/cadmium/mercury/lead-transporting ATPase [Serratia sp. M24T3]